LGGMGPKTVWAGGGSRLKGGECGHKCPKKNPQSNAQTIERRRNGVGGSGGNVEIKTRGEKEVWGQKMK